MAAGIYFLLVEPTDGLSEIGSYVSGAVAPVAFLWFIIGYYQQGQELKENTQALERQQAELEKQAASMAAQVQALHEQNDSLNRPYVVVRPFTEDGSWYNLFIENKGRTSAQNLILSIDRDFYVDNIDSYNLADMYVFQKPIDTLPPNGSITLLLGFGSQIFGDGPDRSRVPLVFQVTARYTYGERTVEETSTVDLQMFGGLRIAKKDPGKELSEIAKTLSKMESSYRASSRRTG